MDTLPVTLGDRPRQQSRSRFGVWLALLLVLGIGAYNWSHNLSPTAQAKRAAHAFWRAVASGDEAAVAAMLADEADLTAAEVIAANRGLETEDRPNGVVHRAMRPNRTGTEVIVSRSIRGPADPVYAPNPIGRVVAMKRVNGSWKVTRQGRTGVSY